MNSINFDDDSAVSTGCSFSFQNDTHQSDIGSHFIELLKLSDWSEALLPDLELINEFFAENGGEEFGKFLFTLGPQNFVSDEEISFAESVRQSKETVDAYLTNRLGDPSGKVPITQECADALKNKMEMIKTDHSHLINFKTYLESEVKLSAERLSSLKEGIASIKKENNDTFQIIKCLVEANEKIFADRKKKLEVFFSKSNLPTPVESNKLDEVFSLQTEVSYQMCKIVRALLEGMSTYDKNTKELLLLLNPLAGVKLYKHKVIINKVLLQIAADWLSLFKQWSLSYNLMSLTSRAYKKLVYMSHIINNSKESVVSLAVDLENINFHQDSDHSMELDSIKTNIEELNQVLSDSSSPSLEKLSVSLQKFDRESITCKNELGKAITDFTSTLETRFDELDKMFNTVNYESSRMINVMNDFESAQKKFDESRKLMNKIAYLEQKKQELFNDFLILAFTDSGKCLARQAELINELELLKKAMG